ncbi:uncharacterized protein [Nicotiana sylvestris]|uniref:uncharacterized protein n=1 Tax=Nicotiana sylvestris TaxID=4096 RepID=UPI00388CE42F
MLRKNAETSWTKDCQKAYDKIKEYLSIPPVLVPPEPGRPLLLYISVLDGAFGCVLGQYDATGRKEQAIYYMSKKFTPYEARMDPLKYIFQKPMPMEKLAKWQILLSEFDVVYEPLKTYFPDEEVSFVGEDITEAYDGWRMFFDGAKNFKGVGIRAVLVSETGQHYPLSAKLRFPCTNNMAEYEACILGLNMAVNINIQELLVIGDSDFLLHQPTYCAHVEEEEDGKPWFHDIKEYLSKGEYLGHANHIQKRTLWRLSNNFFHSGGNLYRRTLDLGFAKYVRKCFQCKVHANMIKVPPNELNATSSPWPFAAWGMDVIGPIEPTTSNGQWFILVVIDYFTKWVEAAS